MATDLRTRLIVQAAIDGISQVREMVREIDKIGDESQESAKQADELLADLQRIAKQSLDGPAEDQERLARETRETRQELERLGNELRELSQQKPIPDPTAGLSKGAAQASSVIKGIPGLLAAIGVTVGLAQVVQAFTDAAKSGESFSRALNIISDSSEAAAAQQQRLLDIAGKYGLEVTGLEKAFINFNAAVAGTNFEGERGNKIFEAFAGSMGLLGKSSAEIEGALLAVNQIISKNTVSAEELRLQLSERLPGAMKLAAEAIGVSEKELSKLLETGQITADELLPRLAEKLREAYSLDSIKRVETLQAAQNRLSNSVTNFFRSLDDATGASSLLSSALDSMTGVIDRVSGSLADADENAQGMAESTDKAAVSLDAASESAGKAAANIDAAAKAEARAVESARQIKDQFDALVIAFNAYSERRQALVDLQDAEEAQQRARIGLLKDEEKQLDLTAEASQRRAQNAVLEAGQLQLLANQAQAYLTQLEAEAEARKDNTAAQLKALDAARQDALIKQRQADAAQALADTLLISADAARDAANETAELDRAAARLGLNFKAASGELSDFVSQALKDLPRVAETGKFTGVQISKAFEDVVSKATNEADIKALEQALAQLGETGALSGQQIADGQELLRKKLAEIKAEAEDLTQSIGSLQAAFDGSLESVRAVTQQLQEQRQAAADAASDNRRLADSQQAAAESTEDAADSTEKATRSLVAQRPELEAGAEAWRDYAETIRQSNAGVKALGGSVSDAAIAEGELATAVAQALDRLQRQSGATSDAAISMEELARQTGIGIEQLRRLDAQSLDRLRSALTDAARRAEDAAERIAELNRRLDELEARQARAEGDDGKARLLEQELSFQEELARVEAEIEQARLFGLTEEINRLEEIKQRLLEIQRLERRRLQEEEKARRERERDSPQSDSGAQSSGASGGTSGASSSAGGGRPPQIFVLPISEAGLQEAVYTEEGIRRHVLPRIERFAGLTR